VFAEDILLDVDVPGFDRSNVDGFALRLRIRSAMEERRGG
jgi:molybdopterin biosynthesis enzyme